MPDPAKVPGKSRRPSRYQEPPPALLGNAEPFSGFSVLEEWQSRDGVVPWTALRDALLWASAPENGRAEMFSDRAAGRRSQELAASEYPEALKRPLGVLSAVLRSHG